MTTKEEVAEAKLHAELLQSRLEQKNVKVQLERADAPAPRWWHSVNFTAVAALIAAIAPLTAGVQGYFQKQRELALETAKQNHEFEMARSRMTEEFHTRYLDRMKDPNERRRLLRLLVATSKDEAVRAWATQELPHADADAVRLDEQMRLRYALQQEALGLAAKTLSSQPEKLSAHYVQVAQDIAAGKLDPKPFVESTGGKIAQTTLSGYLRGLFDEKTKPRFRSHG